MMNVKWLGDRKEVLAWIAAGLCIFVLCLLATFPYDTLQTRLVSELNRATGIDVRIADWSVDWPLGVEWRQVTLSKPDWAPIQLAVLQADLGLLKALRGGLGLDVVIQLDEASPTTGLAKATLAASSFSLGEPVSVTGRLQQIDLSRVLHRYVTHGVLNGNFSHRIDSGRSAAGVIKGEGTWKADATDLTIDQIPLGNGRTVSLAFTKLSAGLTCRDTVCDVTELKGDGIDGSFTGEGTITLQQPILNSQLALTMTIVPGAGLASKANTLGLPPLPAGSSITVKIVGPLAQARIAL
jgi:type II secretion system protein N